MNESARVRYMRHRDGYRSFVIADLGDCENFAEQEPGDVIWRQFMPDDREREFAYQLLREGDGRAWGRIIEL